MYPSQRTLAIEYIQACPTPLPVEEGEWMRGLESLPSPLVEEILCQLPSHLERFDLLLFLTEKMTEASKVTAEKVYSSLVYHASLDQILQWRDVCLRNTGSVPPTTMRIFYAVSRRDVADLACWCVGDGGLDLPECIVHAVETNAPLTARALYSLLGEGVEIPWGRAPLCSNNSELLDWCHSLGWTPGEYQSRTVERAWQSAKTESVQWLYRHYGKTPQREMAVSVLGEYCQSRYLNALYYVLQTWPEIEHQTPYPFRSEWRSLCYVLRTLPQGCRLVGDVILSPTPLPSLRSLGEENGYYHYAI